MVRPDRLPDRIFHAQQAGSASGSLFGKHHGDVGLGNCQPLAILKRRGTDLTKAHLGRANLTGAIWTDAYLLPYYTDSEPNWHSNMDQAWRDSAGILAIDLTSGDINSDGVFDAADYTVWQDNGGDQIDYRTWKDNFGESIASGSGADHVPEPTTLLLTLLALVAAPLRVRCG